MGRHIYWKKFRQPHRFSLNLQFEQLIVPGRATRTPFLESFELEDAAGTCGQSLVQNILRLFRLPSCASLNAFHILPSVNITRLSNFRGFALRLPNI
jgi:hypothetical protein